MITGTRDNMAKFGKFEFVAAGRICPFRIGLFVYVFIIAISALQIHLLLSASELINLTFTQ